MQTYDTTIKTNSPTINNIVSDITNIYGGTTTALAFKKLKTLNTKYGLWADVLWASTTTIIISPKSINGYKWIGCILNDGTYLESSTAITVTLNTSTLDGLGAIQVSQWYILYGYKKASDGTLGFNFGYMPYASVASSTTTTDIKLTQINSQNPNTLFPVGSGFVIWKDGTHFMTPWYDTTGAIYNPSANICYVGSYSGADIIPAGTLPFTPDNTYKIYGVDGFQPINCTTGAINTVIGSNGWLDTGIRIYSNTSSQIQSFYLTSDKFLFMNGKDAGADLTNANGYDQTNNASIYTNYLLIYCPSDKQSFGFDINPSNGANLYKKYHQIYGIAIAYGATSQFQSQQIFPVEHKIICTKYGGGAGNFSITGYML
jgi:hypothetical protein